MLVAKNQKIHIPALSRLKCGVSEDKYNLKYRSGRRRVGHTTQ